MCLPAAALPLVAAATSAAGQLMSGYQSMQAANYEAGVARQNAGLERERARDSIERGRLEARDFYRQAGRVKGQNIASMAANGIDVGYGSAQRLQEDTEMLATEDAENLYRNISERTRGFDINANNFRQESKALRQRGRAQMFGSIIQAGSSLMTGFQQQSMMRARMGLGRAR